MIISNSIKLIRRRDAVFLVRKIKICMVIMLLALSGCGLDAFSLNKDDQAKVAKEEEVHFKIGAALGIEGMVQDNTFNGIAWEGVLQYLNRYPKVKTQQMIPKNDEEKEIDRIIDELLLVKSDIILGFGGHYVDAFEKYAVQNPEVKFVILDGKAEESLPNLLSIEFEDQQSSFLAGIAGALNTKTGKIGFLGGEKNESIMRHQQGFKAGIGYANHFFQTQARLEKSDFTEDFSNIQKGKKLAKGMYKEDIDVVFSCGGSSTLGMMDEAKALLDQGKKIWMIGVDNDMYEFGKIINNKSVILTSAMKNLDIVIYEVLEDYARNRFAGGEYHRRNLNDYGVGLPLENKNFDDKTKKLMEEVTQLLQSGELVIPFEEEELKKFAESFFMEPNAPKEEETGEKPQTHPKI